MIIIEMALSKDNIDEIVKLSREFQEREGCQSKPYGYCNVADA